MQYFRSNLSHSISTFLFLLEIPLWMQCCCLICLFYVSITLVGQWIDNEMANGLINLGLDKFRSWYFIISRYFHEWPIWSRHSSKTYTILQLLAYLVITRIFVSMGITCLLFGLTSLMKEWRGISPKTDPFSTALTAFCFFILILLIWPISVWHSDVLISFLPFLTSYSELSLVIFLIFYSISILLRLVFRVLQILGIQVLNWIFIQLV